MKNAVVYFDGECNLCNGAIQFLIRQDSSEKLLFASLQSKAGQQLLLSQQLEAEHFESMIFSKGRKIYFKSDAALAICGELGGTFNILRLFYIIPRPIRDYMYSVIAKNRYKWFGKRDQCMVPTPELRKRFLE
ncbi:putative DCC family thiol-disulfide oxidoreductase YuxK [Bacillus mesophilus]|uniref:Thiol-disulfide oxidoreductase DCC family protein n=1 Tax=Bacillus mesophilus TaxID=1808955 RepID=A0A6M0Q9J6_9BACI|nr:thiol-disulfide oxidoreductase DCC family protein [Bacillus mesophilus]MBM7662388.1 putative DCC family thiol-disulfide oxidoreductase YuxK [Bacillus mesophilus]NEY72985.1 thiol-disulfide oxidoreductase DCC family protein [Bacillus mesophilus]